MAKTKFSIMMDYHRTLQQAAALDRAAAELARCINKSGENKNQVGAYWHGENAQLYIQKMDLTIEDIRKIQKNIVDTSATIRRIAKRTYDTEMRALLISQRRTYH